MDFIIKTYFFICLLVKPIGKTRILNIIKVFINLKIEPYFYHRFDMHVTDQWRLFKYKIFKTVYVSLVALWFMKNSLKVGSSETPLTL